MTEMSIPSDSFDVRTEEQDLISLSKLLTSTDSSSEFIALTDLSEADLHYNSSNTTLNTAEWRNAYKAIFNLLLLIAVIVVMLSMGCEVTWKNIYGHVKRPVGVIIGMISQFVIMPLSAFSILQICNIGGLHAMGVIITSCSPGGLMSNTFTYFIEGDLPLSLTMTTFSTAMAMAMMPLNIWLYGRYFESDDLVIPYGKMAMSLIIVTFPVLVGMLVKWKWPRVASLVAKLGSYCGMLIAFAFIAVECLLFPENFTDVPVKSCVVVLSLPIFGLTLGYGFAALLRRSVPVRKAISIECGVQNVPLALTVITLSFPMEMQKDIVPIPWLFVISMMTSCTVICFIYHCYMKYSQKMEEEVETEISAKEVPLLEDGRNDESTNGIKIEIKPSIMKNVKQNSKSDSFI